MSDSAYDAAAVCRIIRTCAYGTQAAWTRGVPNRFSIQAVNAVTSIIIGRAIRIHRTLGPGLLESAYAACLRHELASVALRCEIQKSLPLLYGAC